MPKRVMSGPWQARMAAMARFRWWMKTMSCMMSGSRPSTVADPSPCRIRAARCDCSVVLQPAQKPPIHEHMAVATSTGRRPMASDSGTNRKPATQLVSGGSVDSSVTSYSEMGVTPLGTMASGLGLPFMSAVLSTGRGSTPEYSRMKTGRRPATTKSAHMDKLPT